MCVCARARACVRTRVHVCVAVRHMFGGAAHPEVVGEGSVYVVNEWVCLFEGGLDLWLAVPVGNVVHLKVVEMMAACAGGLANVCA